MGDLIRNGGVPVPQVENASSAGNFVGLKGTAGGAMHVESPDGKLATAAKQDAEKTVLDSILAKLSADPATQTTLAAVLAKLSSDPATQTTLAALLTAFNAEDFASQTTLAAILAKLSADPATQTTLAALLTAFNAEDFASQTTLASVAAKLDTLIAKDYATQTTLAALKTAFDAMVSTNGIKKIVDTVPTSVSGFKVTPDTVLINGATVATLGTLTLDGSEEKAIVAIYGSSTSFNVTFKAKGPGGVVDYVQGSWVKSDNSLVIANACSNATHSISSGVLWVFEGLAGFTELQINVWSISNGNITVRAAKVVK